jgi:hypothetical protein
MASARPVDHGGHEGEYREAAAAVSRSNPLTIVTAAVAGDDLPSVARSAADALGSPVAIALPSLGATVHWPAGAWPAEALARLDAAAVAAIADPSAAPDNGAFQAAVVRLGDEVLGVVAALGRAPGESGDRAPWLEATAAAAAVTALRRDAPALDAAGATRALLQMLELRNPADAQALIAQGRRLGCDLSAGAIGICAQVLAGVEVALDGALVADVGAGRVLGLVPPGHDRLAGWLARLRAAGAVVMSSAPRSDPAALGEALREAAVLLELGLDPAALLSGQEETCRLLVGVLLRDPGELDHLRSTTISSLEEYDAAHETDLLATLDAFLAHHGSTTETADAMGLHRHTVGYRLARVQEVSGLSPYESDGRERLSLGLKAHRIIAAEARRASRARTGG